MAYLDLLIVLVLAYLVGSIPFGYLIGRAYGKDIRKEGSGNIGATNVTRVVGPWQGRLCFLLDFLKGALPVLLVSRHYGFVGIPSMLAGAAAVAGHMFPIYLGFKGGKGISTAGGVALALSPLSVLAAAAVWVAVFLLTRYVSVASIAASAALPLTAAVLFFTGKGRMTLAVLIFFCLLGALAIWKHRANIDRLRKGTELRFGGKDGEKK